jgi:hypothetical protein
VRPGAVACLASPRLSTSKTSARFRNAAAAALGPCLVSKPLARHLSPHSMLIRSPLLSSSLAFICALLPAASRSLSRSHMHSVACSLEVIKFICYRCPPPLAFGITCNHLIWIYCIRKELHYILKARILS